MLVIEEEFAISYTLRNHLLAGAQDAGGRKLLSAPAPGPIGDTVVDTTAARDPKASDLLFILSADQVLL